MTVAEKRGLVDPREPRLSLTRQCRLLGLSRGAFYYEPVPVSREDLDLMLFLDKEYTAHPFYGVRRMRMAAISSGLSVGIRHIRRLLRQMGLEAIGPKPRLSIAAPGHRIFPYLLRGLTISSPNQVWSTDITYIPLASGFAYLVAIMDWFSRYVLSWRISTTLDVGFCLEALEESLAGAKPEIFNTDQGSQFTSEAFTSRLLDAKVRVSMDGRGRALDNVFIERLWRSLKYEDVYPRSYDSPAQARSGIARYFRFYNHERGHQAMDYRTPWEVYAGAGSASLDQQKTAPAFKTTGKIPDGEVLARERRSCA